MSFELVIQKAIYEKLLSSADIDQQKIPVYDDVPQANDSGSGEGFPYIVIGEDLLTNWDTDTEYGCDVVITIHTWSRSAGKKEIKTLQGYVYTALHDVEFVMVDYKSVSCSLQQSQSFLDADGVTRHGVQTFSMLIEKL